ncbi:MAG: glycoside hydrolase family 25 protein [Bacteroidaceae bacterium]|nr:glycoside hydrolase family 25 protein [Bacteroidaceae bacterium]
MNKVSNTQTTKQKANKPKSNTTRRSESAVTKTSSSSTLPKPKRQAAKKKGKAGKKGWWTAFVEKLHIRKNLFWFSLIAIAAIFLFFAGEILINKYSFQIRARFGDIVYPEGDVRGIDISHYQGEIDWDKVACTTIGGVPIRFVIVKATEGTDMLDEFFNQNFFQARHKGILRGAYHFFNPSSDPRRQAVYYCRMVQLEDDDLVPVLDVEKTGNLTPERLQKAVKVWMDYVENHYGVTPILYTSSSFRREYLNSPDFDKYPYWIAHYYVKQPKYQGRWYFWQHSDRAHVDGIKGHVDVNLFNGSYEDLLQLTVEECREEE